ncbi:Fibrinogen-like protein 1,Ryncolin-2,Angiopoietin-1,Ryncolin-4,Fibrinogen C domain-containing protein 1,Angiopoietin-related protein 2,Angiopoietin-2,Angiopoietin-related protein 7,Ficolin-2,Ryncolin-1,Tenascin-R,Ryncolin-3,Ficolin-1,Angiopoietin-4 [Mytilus coruscus]|uniref:Fibrinogen C-terminal domain-containing protein n=1 Tax=Mytilus coruscus TaxID=42192 RepID=A0A6J8EBF2_MYTCO|nr:Fibrinogen-like protein 1,Ryncolin-2,Angiopoietin-1,Ryncolin-4,Fibrinogen C domain-containing protein 1,Angiopoietin-related protein 2,Angiopoietin-2,Angiopoietin-related protein 7,Ficolin-2,Ryncolin-1,Tenascin-R,Ryncolin-3,Ficolin-1,Angiopoietin-4 [Mytilus coruscus]
MFNSTLRTWFESELNTTNVSDYFLDGGRTCLSCSGVASVTDCADVETCRDDEACFTHKYTTSSKEEQYDFGCSHQKLCLPGNSGAIFGKRLTGHHMVCQTWCNSTNICNMKSSCVNKLAENSSCGSTESKLPRECDDLTETKTGMYTIYPDGIHPVPVYCIMVNNEKWTVIQRRFNGYVDFYRNWDEYKSGFGSISGEYWLGNDNIHEISSSTTHRLSIYIEDFNGRFANANYSVFNVGDEHRKYQLGVYDFSGTNGLSDHLSSDQNTYMFSTKDQDNDNHDDNCAVQYRQGGFWYNNCGSVNLNGPYMAGPVTTGKGMYWDGWPSSLYSLKKSTMMIKRSMERP